MQNLRRLAVTAILATLLLTALAGSASAHTSKTSADGKIKFTFGWEDEPATTDIPNRVFVRIVDNATGAGIADVEKIEGLTFSLHLGDQEKEFEIAPQRGAGAGNYTSAIVITPSDAGIYELHVEEGQIQGSDIDVEIPANHELEAVEDTYWPTKPQDVAALKQEVELLKAQVEALQAKLSTQASTPATVVSQTPTPTAGNGSSPVPALGLLAVLGAVALVVMLRRSK